ncbi:alpha/beta fold hydrolase [Limibaculum sp. M0105]|uniref:Alpha/beta fold hydrolase n=1 Tax=Thermohalobaculum xanthum TaxID=2753746 RepID=A0A8J7M7G2_9RHOB|nr:alpha/beta fold hydrolase [Thermohalobaculum xanthum]MBK0399698.1 alpha/beta fold hydrolase [Thermohalobaculum xanthum]
MRLWTRLTAYTREAESRYPPLGGFIPVRGAAVHYLSDGPDRGLPLVLLHGASGNLRDWTLSLMPRLARRHRVIALDRPGMGHSGPVAGGTRLDVQADVLAEALEGMGLQRYCLVGHSYSGSLALTWALARPQSVAGVALIAGAAMDWGGALGATYRVAGTPVIGHAFSRIVPLTVDAARIDTALAEIFAPQPVPLRYRHEIGAELALRPHSFRTNYRAVNTLRRQIVALAARYPELRCPIEIVHGDVDAIVPADIHAIPLAELLDRADLTLLPGIGHMPHHAAPETVMAAIERLVSRATARPRQRAAQAPQRQSPGPSVM